MLRTRARDGAAPAGRHRGPAMLSRALALAVLVLAGSGPDATAQPYPGRPIRMIVPLAPASTVDIVARKLGEQLAIRMGQPFIVENKPGAGGVIGTAEIARAAPDGYVLGMISSNHVINPGMIKSIPFDTLKDITPISVVGTVPLVLVVNPSVPAKSVAELIALAKAKPGQIDYGSAGTGSVIHLAGVLFTSEAGIEMRHVPYRGTGPLTNDLVANHVGVGFLSVTAALPQIEAGTLRPLAVSTPTRVARLPTVPTMAESGLPNYSFDGWIAMIGPKNLPAALSERLFREVSAVLAQPRIRDEFAEQGVTVIGSDPATAAAFFASELPKHQALVAASGAKAE